MLLGTILALSLPPTVQLKCSVGGGGEGAIIGPQLYVHVLHAIEGSLKCFHVLDSDFIIVSCRTIYQFYAPKMLELTMFSLFFSINLLCSKVLKKPWRV